MRIEIIDKNNDLITDFESKTNPFKLGETINITVQNDDKSFWDIKEVNGSFKIEKIEHFLRTNYTPNQMYFSTFVVSVEVSNLP